MKADASRIEILTFANVPVYTEAGHQLVEAPPSEERASRATARVQPVLADAAATPSAPMRPFDARFATCSLTRDRDKLLSVIESCGNGLETFNEWVHETLKKSSAPSDADAAPGLDGASSASGAPAVGHGIMALALGRRARAHHWW